MPINIPSSTTTTLGTIEVPDILGTVHYQQFVLTSPSGAALGSTEAPIPVELIVPSTFVQTFNADSTVLPVGGTYYQENVINNGNELADSELSVLRTTVRGSLKTAGDGRVNEIVSSYSDGYDDIYVSEDSFDRYGMQTISVSGVFFDTTRSNARYFYIPMIRSGWRKLSFSFWSPAAGTLTLYADLGFIDDDLIVGTYNVYAGMRYGYMPDAPSVTTSGAITHVPALASPVNAFIVEFVPSEQAAGSLQLHLVRGA
jgi:hypothetical protein